MSDRIYKKALASAERCIPKGLDNRTLRINLFVQGYVTGHAAHTRWANKTIEEYRRAVSASPEGK